MFAVALRSERSVAEDVVRLEQLLKYFVERPTTAEIQTLRRWIAAGMPHSNAEAAAIRGAPDPLVTDRNRQDWAFQPLLQVADVDLAPLAAGC